jgi:hypothetical protein
MHVCATNTALYSTRLVPSLSGIKIPCMQLPLLLASLMSPWTAY